MSFLPVRVRMRGLEPPRPEGHTDLNRARLPIPPHPRAWDSVAGRPRDFGRRDGREQTDARAEPARPEARHRKWRRGRYIRGRRTVEPRAGGNPGEVFRSRPGLGDRALELADVVREVALALGQAPLALLELLGELVELVLPQLELGAEAGLAEAKLVRLLLELGLAAGNLELAL